MVENTQNIFEKAQQIEDARIALSTAALNFAMAKGYADKTASYAAWSDLWNLIEKNFNTRGFDITEVAQYKPMTDIDPEML